jgi:AcrR family transcriptional regulator
MPRSPVPARSRILDAAYTLFYSRGFTRVGLDEIASAAGLTKRTLYQHFESKDALLAAVMEYDVTLSTPRIARWMEAIEADAEAGLDRVFANLAAWTRSPGWMGAGFTRIVAELADLPGHPAHRIARSHKQAIEAPLTRALDSPTRAMAFMIVVEGTLIQMLIHRDPRILDAGKCAARQIVCGLSGLRGVRRETGKE